MKTNIEVFAIPNNGNENVKTQAIDSIVICSYSKEIAPCLFNQVRRISQLQPISDMWIYNIRRNDTGNTDVFNMSHKTRSIHVVSCILPAATLDHLLQQISMSSKITRIAFDGTNLCDIKSLSLQYLPSLTHLDLWNTNLCLFHILHLGYLIENRKLPKLMEINLGKNNLHAIQEDVDILLQTIAKHHQINIVAAIQDYNLPNTFVQRVTEYANDSKFLTILADGNNENNTEQVDTENLEEVFRPIYKIIHPRMNETPLQDLSLKDLKFSPHLCGPILKVLSDHRGIINLDLSGHVFGIHGYHLVNAIKNWGREPSQGVFC